ncbi:MAG: DUF4215 domain-containing protein [Candidatus Binatia bacterium]
MKRVALLTVTVSLLLLGGTPERADAVNCVLTVGLVDAVTVSAVTVEIDYPGSGAGIVGEGISTQCSAVGADTLAAFNDVGASSHLVAGLVNFRGITGPAELFSCDVEAVSVPAAQDFSLTVVDVVDPQLNVVDPAPTLSVASIQCDTTASDPSTSTSTTSTSTSTSTTTTVPVGGCWGSEFEVSFAVDGGGAYSAYQFTVDYSALSGGFVGAGAEVDCSVQAAGVLSSFNNVTGQRRLNAALVALAGFDGQDPIVSCRFESGGGYPAVSDFVVQTIDATYADMNPAWPLPATVVSEILPLGGAGCGVCGDGTLDVGEQCDDGGANSDLSPDACRSDCSLPACGDGVADSGEQCDDGVANSDLSPDACRSDCTLPVCGDAVTDSGEQCDDGNQDDSDACPSTCVAAYCGDTFVRAGVEECDDGALNSDFMADACRSGCVLPYCGDAVTDSGEQCDDADEDNNDECLVGCLEAWCGDGFLYQGVEECDMGEFNNDFEEEGCYSDCRVKGLCGDANRDWTISVVDARQVLRSAVGLAESCDFSHCDTDGNGTLSALDARRVLRTAVGQNVALDCRLGVTLVLDSAESYGAIQLVVDYGDTGSGFVGAADGVLCESLLDDQDIVVFNNAVDLDQLVVGLVSLQGLSGPTEVARCSFLSRELPPEATSFGIEVTDYAGVYLEQLPPPELHLEY